MDDKEIPVTPDSRDKRPTPVININTGPNRLTQPELNIPLDKKGSLKKRLVTILGLGGLVTVLGLGGYFGISRAQDQLNEQAKGQAAQPVSDMDKSRANNSLNYTDTRNSSPLEAKSTIIDKPAK